MRGFCVFLNGTALFLVVRAMFGNPSYDEKYYTVAGNEVYFREVGLSVDMAAHAAGMQAHIAKPIDTGILENELSKVLQTKC